MRVVVCLPEGGQPWAEALQAALPEAQVQWWQPGAEQADFALIWQPPEAFFAEQTQLKAVFGAGAGVDAFVERVPPTLPLYRTEDAGMGALMAEYLLYALLRWHRQFDRYDTHERWEPLPAQKREDWTVGVLGCGVLGRQVARAAQQLGFPVRGWVRTPREDAEIPLCAGLDALPDFLAGTRVLVALLPLTAATRGLLNAERFAQLPPGACFVNLARGGLVVQEDLLAALDSGHLHAAQLDVTSPEPLPPEHPFWRHPRIRLTPHVAALTPRAAAVAQIADKMRRLARGEAVSGRVGPEGY
ncbi:MAG: glyoxylate/hydroxypyruvate reductase A [Burkholderiales bacterium]|uniref:2-hydroxyacid dehydrogenase n=1 Tax=Inhella sp. TaxID=1921806 RepID=UPI001AC89D83|nr:glyoxylate/hydroxypyruvate reductase A [Burkholderiales bacterium]